MTCFTKIKLVLFLLAVFLVQTSNSQISEPTAGNEAVLHRPLSADYIFKDYFFRPYSLNGITLGCIGYGILSLGSDQIKSWNAEAREEVWEEHPHTFNHLDNYLQFAPALAVYGLNACGIKGKYNFKDRTVSLAGAFLITGITVTALKSITHVERPDGSNFKSFPSGHTATAFMTAEYLRQEYKDVSPWIPVAGYAAAAVTGYMRLYNNKHWASDVFAGAAVGVLGTQLTYYLQARAKHHYAMKHHNVSYN